MYEEGCIMKLLLCVISVFTLAILLFFIKGLSGSVSNKKTSETIYTRQASQICMDLNRAHSLFKQGKNREAYQLSQQAYWQKYDNLIEIKYRSYGTPQEIFETENSFHEISQLIATKNMGKSRQIKRKINNLCKIIKKQADSI